MKKISFKSMRESVQRRQRNQVVKDDPPSVGRDGETASSRGGGDKQCNNDSHHMSQQNYATVPETTTDSNRKKERFGLLKSFKRRLTSNFRRKRDSDRDSRHHINDECGHYMITAGSKETKSKQKCRLAFCDLSSKSNSSSHSCDSLDLNLAAMQKISDLHLNTDSRDSLSTKEKASCKSKDMKFHLSDRTKLDRISREQSSGASSNKNCDLANARNSCLNVHGDSPVANIDELHQDNDITYCDEIRCPKPKMWSLTTELFRLSKFGWYWGPITRVEAEEKLANQPDGAFLVRDSSDERYLLSLSFRSYGRTWHTRIEHCNGMFSFYAQPDTEGYPSIVDLIEHSMNDSQTGIFCYSRSRSPYAPSFAVRLTKPVSRFTQVRSLQYLCRFVIRQYTRYDHIQQLPLPNKIKGWIEENQY